jgi:hypothetical protein
MKFRKIGINAAEAEEGFSVCRKSRYELEYCEAGKSISIEVEPGEGLAIYTSSLKLDTENKKRVIKNICAALEFLKIEYVID